MSTNAYTSTPQREAHVADALRGMASAVGKGIVDALPTCVACTYFNEAAEICTLAAARPPARVIAHGCTSFSALAPF